MKDKQASGSGKNQPDDVAQLTQADIIDSSDSNNINISYYNTAFSVTNNSLPTIFDTGASSHMFGDLRLFTSMTTSEPSRIAVASKGGANWSKERGCVMIGRLSIHNVIYSNKLTANLISIDWLCDSGYSSVFHQNTGYLIDSHCRILLHMKCDPRTDCLWHPNIKHHHSALSASINRTDQAILWHWQLGHTHPATVIEHLWKNYNITVSRRDFPPSDSCAMGILSQSPSSSPSHWSSQILDVIHSDLMGPTSSPTQSGVQYIMTFVDDYTRFNPCYLLRNKNEAFSKFKEYKAMIKKQTGVVSRNVH